MLIVAIIFLLLSVSVILRHGPGHRGDELGVKVIAVAIFLASAITIIIKCI